MRSILNQFFDDFHHPTLKEVVRLKELLLQEHRAGPGKLPSRWPFWPP